MKFSAEIINERKRFWGLKSLNLILNFKLIKAIPLNLCLYAHFQCAVKYFDIHLIPLT